MTEYKRKEFTLMKESIIVSVSELRSKLQDIRRSGCELVCVTIYDASESDGDTIPPCISFSACRQYAPDVWYDFEEVEAIPNEAEIFEKQYSGIEMSSNLI